jgi:cytochrome P450
VLEILAQGHPEVPALLNEDPPTHRRTRALVAKTFSARRIAGLQPGVAAIVTELLDAMQPRGEADLVAELATPLPLRVICELIGLPASDASRIRAWIEQLALLTSFGASPEEQRTAARGSVDFERYLAAAVADRRAAGRDDLLTDLIRARADGAAPLTDEEIISLLISLVFAGHETTANLIASALVLLLHRPELWETAGDDPDLVASVVEETLRIDAPVQGMFGGPCSTCRSPECRSRPALRCTRCSRPPTGTVRRSTDRTSSTRGGPTRTGTSRSAAASTSVSAPRWPGWRHRPR